MLGPRSEALLYYNHQPSDTSQFACVWLVVDYSIQASSLQCDSDVPRVARAADWLWQSLACFHHLNN